jgi:predicted nucleotidyltransferase
MKTLDSLTISENERAAAVQAREVLTADLPVSRVVLFGSRARGQGDRYSDIDLLVLTSCPVDSKLRRDISDRLAEINLQSDVMLSSVVVSEEDWSRGLIRYMLIHNEVEKDGCQI